MRQLGVQTRGASGLPLVTTGGDSLPSLFLSVCDEAGWEGVGPGDGHRSKAASTMSPCG